MPPLRGYFAICSTTSRTNNPNPHSPQCLRRLRRTMPCAGRASKNYVNILLKLNTDILTRMPMIKPHWRREKGMVLGSDAVYTDITSERESETRQGANANDATTARKTCVCVCGCVLRTSQHRAHSHRESRNLHK